MRHLLDSPVSGSENVDMKRMAEYRSRNFKTPGCLSSLRRGVWVALAALGLSGTAHAQSPSNLLTPCLPDSEQDLYNKQIFADKNWLYCNPDGTEAEGQYGYFSQLNAGLQFQYCYQDEGNLLTLVALPAEGFLADDMIVALGYGNRLTGDNELTQYFYRVPINITAAGNYYLTGCVRAANADTFVSQVNSDTDYVDRSKSLVVVAVKESDEALTFEGEKTDNLPRITGVRSAGEERPYMARRIYTNTEGEIWVDDPDWFSSSAKPFNTTLALSPEYKYLRFYAPKSQSPIPEYPVILNQLSLKPEVITGIEAVDTPQQGGERYYNLQGVPVANPVSGPYIRLNNGKAEKIVL